GQTLKVFGATWAPSPAGAHTGAVNLTVMTDAFAAFVANELIGLIIMNVTDGSSGTVTANTVNTVTVAALVGGITNRWNFGDIYMVAGAFPWVVPSLAPGGMVHMFDVDTGLPMPFTVPQGYTLAVIAAAAAVTEDAQGWGYFDGFLVECAGQAAGGTTYFENKLKGIDTSLFDPTGATAHLIDITITNQGLGALRGSIDYLCILSEVGTPPLPTVKTVRCHWCGEHQEVPREITRITCVKCGKLFIVYDLSKIRRTP
ncbi:MAG: hypothetical protein Q8K55_11470, partial [Gemmatimonadaceae bacterium]|nr:hypothetical protein [Gemmatimonadaceae bacterium]